MTIFKNSNAYLLGIPDRGIKGESRDWEPYVRDKMYGDDSGHIKPYLEAFCGVEGIRKSLGLT